MTPEATAIAESQAAKDRALLEALRLRSQTTHWRVKVNLAIRPKSKKRRR